LEMYVTKRDGTHEEVSFDKVLKRIKAAAKGLDVNPVIISQKTLARIYNGVHTTELDELSARLAISLTATHPDYGILASQIAVSNHQRNTNESFCNIMKQLSIQTHPRTGEEYSTISSNFIKMLKGREEEIDAAINHERDFLFDYFGFKTLEKQYLLRDSNGIVLERPQYMYMRVAIALWGHLPTLDRAFETYELLSTKKFTHATPTLFNAGMPRQQCSSCYLLSMHDDSIAGIYKTLGDCALISKYAGGIGLHIHDIRAKGSTIRGTNGTSNGIVPMLRVFNNTARYVDQCFTPETLVLTELGEEAICTILPGQKVRTSTGYHTVLKQVTHNYNGPMLTITLEGHKKSVTVTGEHPILSIKTSGHPLEELQNALSIGTYVIDYNEAKELSVGDYTVFPGGKLERIKSIFETQYKGIVYDFEIDGPHDYTIVHLGIAHNGGGKRNGSFAIYLEPWHADIEDFLMLKRNTGSEEERARDLFYALWISDLFMERVEADGEWTLFCPMEAPGLSDVWGDKFRELYERYEKEGRGRQKVSAQKLWFKILDSQIETGTPYLLYKDAANAKSNQQNLGTIKSSNLCSEVLQYSSPTETAVCNLASINLTAFVDQKRRQFDFEELRRVSAIAIRNLNRIIDINYYPTPETERSNMRHRPVGLGVQGLADVFAMLRMPWETEKAAALNREIFEHMYYAAVEESAELAAHEGAYDSFEGSPVSRGKLQPDLWNVKPISDLDWEGLRKKAASGLRNSLLIAPMPTASTSQICGSNECFEPFTSNIYTRRTLAGEFIVINKYLLRDLIRYDVWSEELKQKIIAQNGSVQGLDEIPKVIQELYKTSYEIKQRTLIDMAADRGAFICQSQSLNLFVSDPTYSKLTSMHFYGWRQGLKTGIYYLRTKAPVAAQKFTVDPELIASIVADKKARIHEEEGCLMCSG
jgi:ribonucleoside-diphosphate reductase alpha subunit